MTLHLQGRGGADADCPVMSGCVGMGEAFLGVVEVGAWLVPTQISRVCTVRHRAGAWGESVVEEERGSAIRT